MDQLEAVKSTISSSLKFTYSDRIFNAHEIKNELLVNYLYRRHNENKHIHFSTLFDNIFKTSFLPNTPEAEIQLDNGWTILVKKYYHDEANNAIAIPILSSTNRINELYSSKSTATINELSILKLIYTNIHKDSNPNFGIIAMNRLFTDYKPMSINAFTYINYDNLLSSEDTISMLTERTDLLGEALSANKEPERCGDVKFHKQKGITTNMTCTYYCNISDNCKHKNKYMSDRAKLKNIIF